eukprot:354084-Chlamydomonas_euryale.AAC.6
MAPVARAARSVHIADTGRARPGAGMRTRGRCMGACKHIGKAKLHHGWARCKGTSEGTGKGTAWHGMAWHGCMHEWARCMSACMEIGTAKAHAWTALPQGHMQIHRHDMAWHDMAWHGMGECMGGIAT